MITFKEYLKEDEDKSVIFTFGRMNPPSLGHEKLLRSMNEAVGSSDCHIYLSKTSDSKKNPLEYNEKIKFVRKMFPKYGRNIILDESISDILSVLVKLYNENYKKVTLMVGSDRVDELKKLTNKYNGLENYKHGFYKFNEGIKVLSAGERDQDGTISESVSSSQMREHAMNDNFGEFAKCVPSQYNDLRDLFNAVRHGLNLKESTKCRIGLNLGIKSDIREQYVKGEIYNKDDSVIFEGTKYVIDYCGPNYLIIKNNSDKKRVWLEDVAKIS